MFGKRDNGTLFGCGRYEMFRRETGRKLYTMNKEVGWKVSERLERVTMSLIWGIWRERERRGKRRNLSN